MKIKKSLLLLAGSLFLAASGAGAAEILRTPDLRLNLGARFKLMGELEYLEADTVRNRTRIYLFNTQDRLLLSGDYDGTRFFYESAFGGEAVNTSNNQINLLEFFAETPVHEEQLAFFFGQFKVPSNYDSAKDSGSLFFTEKSMLTQMFFNTGYDTGVGFRAKAGDFDALLGTLAGAPDMPQRYLPEIFNLPPLTFLRLGYDGLGEDPFHPRQVPAEAPQSSQWALHLNGMYLNDSNAGHSTDAALGSGYFDAASANSHYGNILLSGKWNPLLGKMAANFGRVTAKYWQASVDAQWRKPLDGRVLSLGCQYTISQFIAGDFAPFMMNGQWIGSGIITLQGAQAEAALTAGHWDLAARYVYVVPDASLAAPAANQTAKKEFNSILGSDPIYELTFPAVGWRVNKAMKITAEAIFQFNAPVDTADDGAYLLSEMPSQVSNTTRQNPQQAGVPQYYFLRTNVVPIGRLEWQFQF